MVKPLHCAAKRRPIADIEGTPTTKPSMGRSTVSRIRHELQSPEQAKHLKRPGGGQGSTMPSSAALSGPKGCNNCTPMSKCRVGSSLPFTNFVQSFPPKPRLSWTRITSRPASQSQRQQLNPAGPPPMTQTDRIAPNSLPPKAEAAEGRGNTRGFDRVGKGPSRSSKTTSRACVSAASSASAAAARFSAACDPAPAPSPAARCQRPRRGAPPAVPG
mmetsp:Transcript_148615/g.477143  ORF Transcript_148615/g.477143 Transcript_148615/m.477143 type:complete len:216 (+) Transcript_148615:1037-1684(+)